MALSTLGKGSPNPEPQAPSVTPLQTPPFPSNLPTGFFVQAVDLSIPTGGGSATTIKTPQTAIAVIGLSISVAGVAPIQASVVLAQIQDTDGGRPIAFGSYGFFKGTKTAFGMQPINPERQQVVVSVSAQTVDSGSIFSGLVLFLCGPTRGFIPQTIPFSVVGNPDGSVEITVSFTSASNTAQTVDIKTLTQADAIELLEAWFYNSGAGTSTGNMGFWDGTTRVDIDTTAAVASYIFNQGTKGIQNGPPTIQAGGNVTGLTLRFVIGAGGVGVTTTLFVTYRVRLIR